MLRLHAPLVVQDGLADAEVLGGDLQQLVIRQEFQALLQWIAVVIVFLLDRLLPQLFALCIDLPATFTCISRYVCRSDAIPNRCWISTILISTTGSIPGRSVCQKTIVFLFCVGFPRLA